MAKIQSRGASSLLISERLEAVRRVQRPRDYIGASILGAKCDRALFYTKERVTTPSVEARVLRIFEFGDAIETLAVKWLRDAGFYVYDRDPRTNDQFLIRAADMTFQGHSDGLISSVPLNPVLFGAGGMQKRPMVLEIKSHKDNRFLDVVDLGVEAAHFEHYAQMQTYMGESDQFLEAFGLTGMIDLALYMAVNKNTSEVYFEEVPFSEECFLRLASRARRVSRATAPPPRLAVSPTKSPCNYCDYKIHCFRDERAPKEISLGTCDADGPRIATKATPPNAPNLRNPKWGFPDISRRNATESRGGATWRD